MKTPTRQPLTNQNAQSAQAVTYPRVYPRVYPAAEGGQEAGSKLPPTPEIQNLLATQDLCLSQLGGAVANLRERLASVLVDIPASGSANDCAKAVAGSDLGKALDAHNDRISEVTSHIEYLTNQLAV